MRNPQEKNAASTAATPQIARTASSCLWSDPALQNPSQRPAHGHGTIIYPGTFDPLTLGHLDLIKRISSLFDRVVIAVAATSNKQGQMFDSEERIDMAREVLVDFPNVEVKRMDGLLIDFVRAEGCRVVLRGLRAFSDFEYEFQMALTNRKMAPEIETLFMMPNEEHSYVTSSTVREVARYAGDTSKFVPAAVQRHIERRVVMDRLCAGAPWKKKRD